MRFAAYFCGFFLCGILASKAGFTLPSPKPILLGTGFVVASNGSIVTNQHVVNGCKSISVHGAEEESATLIATDAEHDLALLRINGITPHIAPLRYVSGTLRTGDEAVVIGYPGISGFTGQQVFATTTIADTKGPRGEEHWLQFADSVQKGNSGGPLLDRSGNVIGVVTGKIQRYDSDPKENPNAKMLSVRDYAVTLPILKRFLQQNGVYPKVGTNRLERSDRLLSKGATDYLVNVRCYLR